MDSSSMHGTLTTRNDALYSCMDGWLDGWMDGRDGGREGGMDGGV